MQAPARAGTALNGTRQGVLAVACAEELPADGAAHGVLLWSFRDPIRPEAVLESAVEARRALGSNGVGTAVPRLCPALRTTRHACMRMPGCMQTRFSCGKPASAWLVQVGCFQVNPATPHLVAGGCETGQVVLWDTSAAEVASHVSAWLRRLLNDRQASGYS